MIESFETKKSLRPWLSTLVAIVALIIGVFYASWWLARPPADFPLNAAITIPRGLSASAIADLMKEHGAVRSAAYLYVTLIMSHDPQSVQAGTYVFDTPLNVKQVADKITTSGATDNLKALTLPEGYTVREYARLANTALPEFDSETFLAIALKDEGYLFPDTYYLPEDFTAEELHELLKNTFEQKISGLQEAIDAKGWPLTDVLITTTTPRVKYGPTSRRLNRIRVRKTSR